MVAGFVQVKFPEETKAESTMLFNNSAFGSDSPVPHAFYWLQSPTVIHCERGLQTHGARGVHWLLSWRLATKYI